MPHPTRVDVVTALDGILERLLRAARAAVSRRDTQAFVDALNLLTPLSLVCWHLGNRKLSAASVAPLLPALAEYLDSLLDASRSARGRAPAPTSTAKHRKQRKRSKVTS